MKVIIAGSRHITDFEKVCNAIEASGWASIIKEVVCGMASGVDEQGHFWARQRGLSVKEFFPKWGEHGSAAGPIRNMEMAKYADALILVWDGESRGSRSMKGCAQACGIPIYEVVV